MVGFGSFDAGFGVMSTIFPILFIFVFGLILAVIVVMLVKGISQWRSNNASPVLTVEANVVVKRGDVSHRMDSDSGMHHSDTTYYATFQVESGDQMEFRLSGQEYGMLAEGDRGMLTFQGTRYLGFERHG